MLMQLKVTYHLWIEQRHGIRRDGIAKSRIELFGDGRASDDGTAFQYGHAQSCIGQVGGTHQAVMAAADDQYITGSGHREPLQVMRRALSLQLSTHVNDFGRGAAHSSTSEP